MKRDLNFLTGQFPELKKWSKPLPLPWYAIKPNIFDLEKTLGIKREPDFWELIKEYLKNEIENDLLK